MGRPPEAVGKIQLPSHTRPDPRRSQHGRPKCDPTTESAKSCSSQKLRYLLLAPPNEKSVAQGLFCGSGRMAVAHTRPAFPKNAYGLFGITLIRGASGAGRLTQPHSKGGKSLGKASWSRRKIFSYRATPSQIRAAASTACRSATRQLNQKAAPIRSCGICYSPHLTSKCGTRPFLGGTGRRAVAHTHPAFPKNAYGPFGIPLIRGASGAGRLTQPPSKGGKRLGGIVLLDLWGFCWFIGDTFL